MTLTLALAEKIIDGTRLYAAENNIKPLAVVVLDAGAHPVAFKREDKASLYRFDIAMAKAKGALGMGFNTRDIAEKAKNNPVFFASVTAINGIELALSPGGNLIKDANGNILGAIGISGDTGDNDELCAQAGIDAVAAQLENL
ncbi:GlcG/HbpS family heme-binding protein [Alteromonas confluentis]|uniref:GlcG protein n=1 Tax=Alteromonas confluentis TaxID=1656094 RepID=A0A1E7ZA50_9ALTE|nr:heme-binding protein [Alteromonas confluentis]OFC70408.1 GlcG protein [Alteromonas confluentis]